MKETQYHHYFITTEVKFIPTIPQYNNLNDDPQYKAVGKFLYPTPPKGMIFQLF